MGRGPYLSVVESIPSFNMALLSVNCVLGAIIIREILTLPAV